MWEHVGQIRGCAVIRVAVQQHHRHLAVLYQARKIGHQRGVRAGQGEIGGTVPGGDLRRKAAVDAGPGWGAQQHRISQSRFAGLPSP